ncbi:CDP-diacylglycerol--glycerol-3-phosphate 3-phosphatidyltransferase [Gammaproteobacteria bacterium]|nr:CDP-diacylglycerol--glycerol-3-phosphate 3-phosphatidyltransferase [Gammaproteobacteria bacterium]
MNYLIQSLTYFRILSAPIIFLLIVSNEYGWALFILILASSSDYWDGYLARKYNLESILGSILDPIADKMLLTFLILSFALTMQSTYIAFAGGIMLVREFWVAALRDFNSRNNNIEATKVSFLAKIKTFSQFTAFSVLLLGLYSGNEIFLLTGNFVLLAALIITLQSGVEYTVRTFRKL